MTREEVLAIGFTVAVFGAIIVGLLGVAWWDAISHARELARGRREEDEALTEARSWMGWRP